MEASVKLENLINNHTYLEHNQQACLDRIRDLNNPSILKQEITTLIDWTCKSRAHERALKQLNNDMLSKRINSSDFVAKFDEYLKIELENIDVTRDENYVDLFGDEEDDDGLQMVGSTLQTKCPYTLVVMRDPYKNVCGHSYSKEFVDLVKRNGVMRCPVAGCAHDVLPNGLKPNTILKRKIERHLAQK